MHHTAPELVTQALLDELRRISPFDPDHLPNEIELIETFRSAHPNLPQIACFDTAFHRTMPLVARQLPIPRRYGIQGLERYGFHGLSYAFLTEELRRLGDPAVTKGRVILAHLGNGASMAALLNGKSIDTSMSFTPTAGRSLPHLRGAGLSRYRAERLAQCPPLWRDFRGRQSGHRARHSHRRRVDACAVGLRFSRKRMTYK
jgi:acetate kinase